MNHIDLSPHSTESEQSLIGALLLDNSAWDRIDTFDPDACYNSAHRDILRAILGLLEQSKPADVFTVSEALERAGKLEEVGGLAYLGQIANDTPSAASIRRYAEIVTERATLRALLAAGGDIQTIALEPNGETSSERVVRAANLVNSILEGQIKGGGPVDYAQATQIAVQKLQDACEQTDKYSTGLVDLDALLVDYCPGAMVVVAGRPGMGKSAFALKLAHSAIDDETRPGAVALFSMEMATAQVIQRSLSIRKQIPYADLLSANLTDDQYRDITAYSTGAFRNPYSFFVDDSGGLALAQIKARCNVIRRKAKGLKLVVIDYLQLMSGKGDNREQEISGISRGLKAMAKDFGIPVVVLSQLSRKCDERPNKRPMPSDLRESGAIEQDADLIIFPYRDEAYNKDSNDRGTAEIIIGKQRNGPSGCHARVAFKAEFMEFCNLDYQAWQEQQRAYESQRVNAKPMKRKGGFD